MSVLIKGGRIVTAADDYVGDVYVENGTVSLIGESLDVSADKVIDATGKYVLPGAIDPHTHLEMFFGGTTTCDDFTSGTVSAAFGGTTCLVDFCMQAPGTSFAQALENYFEKIDRAKPVIDVGFHIGVTDLREGGSLEELATLPDKGITSYKLFMAYKGAVMVDDETLFKTMQTAADTGALVMVHAENGDAIDIIVKEAVAAGHTEPIWHARTRPPETEGEATNRAIQLARIAGANLYVVHVSCQESIEPIAIAREKGWNVWGETCTQYLFIDESALDQPGFEGAKYIYTPPPRPKENQEHLWHALHGDVLSVVSTDHCPVQLARAEGHQRPGVPEGAERRAGDREPAAHAARVRRAHRPDEPQPVRRADLDERRALVRALPAQGHDRAGLGRGHRRLGSREEADHLGQDAPLERELQPVRGHRGDRGARGRARPRPGDRRERRARRAAGRRAVREAREGRRGAAAGRESAGVSDAEAKEVYEKARLGQAVTLGSSPAVLVIDFSCGFTDPACALGADMTAEVEATRRLLDRARDKGLPVVFTTIGFEPSGKDGGLWLEKAPALRDLELGGHWVEIDPRLDRRDDEPIVLKKGASGFFGTNLASILVSQGVDTVILCGATTSGCVRATAVDLLQYGWPTLVPRECVGDRAQAPHDANLFDIQAKYADVVPLEDALAYVESVPTLRVGAGV